MVNTCKLIILVLLLFSCKTGVKVYLKLDDFIIYSKSLNKRDIENYTPLNIEKKNIIDNQSIIVAGKLRLVGSSRNRRLVITTLGDYDIQVLFKSNLVAEYIMLFQNQIVEINGFIEVKKMYAPDGTFVHNKYILVADSLCIITN